MGIEATALERPRLLIEQGLVEHSAALLAAARLITLDEAEAQDVVQTTFELALRKAGALRDPALLRPWLLTIAAREAMRRARLLRRWVSLVPQVHELPAQEPSDQLLALHAGLRALPRRCRAAIALHYLCGYSVRETAQVLGVSENTIKTQLKAGLAAA